MKRLIVISGAGISAESGVRTFRTDEKSGKAMWDEFDVDEVCNIRRFEEDAYQTTHNFYNKRREEMASVEPNAAHLRIAEWWKRYPGRVLNLTTNVDDLFERAGIEHEEIVHIHGYLPEVLISASDMHKYPDARPQSFYGQYAGVINVGNTSVDTSTLAKCKPYVTFFGEASDKYQLLYNMLDDITSQDMIILVGCSNTVINFYWELFPLLNQGTKLIVVNPRLGSDVYELERRGVEYYHTGAVDAFSNPKLIETVEKHLDL